MNKEESDLPQLLFGMVVLAMFFFAMVMLSGCSTATNIKIEPLKRPTLDIVNQKPIILSPIQFHIQIYNKIPSYCLSTENFSNLSNNMEKIQNYLYIDEQTIDAYKKYYEADPIK